ncbi:aminotransferase class I/II-fold pyridoxal phosphate-dependent enzyme [Streptomyces sp. NPDC015350]|uniref:aminotransferase class I/II-fold pyridoxal phosphate-dependent enzyme n=1 Tax=Streptomyces sp. NPDC015350 TaxID=3364955 RepID=UPI0036F96A5E
MGPPPSAVQALLTFLQQQPAALVPPPYETEHPPHTGHKRFLSAYADHLGAHALAADMLAGQGVTGFLVILAQFLRGQRTAIITPEYTETLELFSYATFVAPADGRRDTAEQRLDRVLRAMRTHDYVLLSNPSNPYGHIIDAESLVVACRKYPQCQLVLDEEYVEFAGPGRSLIGAEVDNLVILQSAGKTYGITGSRSGMLWTRNTALRRQIEAHLARKWPMSLLDVTLAIAALQDETWLETVMPRLAKDAHRLENLLYDHFGDALAPGAQAHFRFVTLDPASGDADSIRRHMSRHGIKARVFDGCLKGSQAGMRLRAPCDEGGFTALEAALNTMHWATWCDATTPERRDPA